MLLELFKIYILSIKSCEYNLKSFIISVCNQGIKLLPTRVINNLELHIALWPFSVHCESLDSLVLFLSQTSFISFLRSIFCASPFFICEFDSRLSDFSRCFPPMSLRTWLFTKQPISNFSSSYMS